MTVSMRTAGQQDLSAVYARAVKAAKRGDVEAVEQELKEIRRLNSAGSGTVGTTLRTIARCVRSHPSTVA